MKNVYLRKGGYWFARQINKKRIWVNLRTPDYVEAARRAIEIENNPLLSSPGGMRDDIARFVAHKLKENRYSEQSAKTKVLALNQLADFLPPSATVHTVNSKQVEDYYRHLQDPKRPQGRVTESTAQSYMMTIRSFFRWAMEVERLRLDNPVKAVRLHRHDKKAREKAASRTTKNRLIAEAPTDDMKFILFCGFDAGLRKAEISEARVDWFDEQSVHVTKAEGKRLRDGDKKWTPKDRDERSIPLTAPFREFLKGYLAGKKPLDYALQPDVKQGKWRYRYDIRRPFTDYMVKQGEPWITPHVMRHTFASVLASAGVSIFKISDWLGDDVRVTQRNYAHLEPGDQDIHALS